MKLSASRLKNLDYKQLLINHGEKAGLTVVLLIVAWALMGTNWTPYTKSTPAQLVSDAEKAKEAIAVKPWPAEEQKKLQTGGDLVAKVDEMLTPIASNLRLIGFYHPLHPEKRRITKPRWFAVDELIADASVANLEMNDSVKPLDEGFGRKVVKDDSKEKPKKEKKPSIKKNPEKEDGNDEDVAPEFRPKSPVGGGGRLGASQLGILRGRDKDSKRKDKGGKYSDSIVDADAVAAATAPVKHVRVGHGYHFVAIRGVFPLQKEVQELMRARGDSATANARQVQDQVSISSFVLERQTKKAGADPWGGAWEPVDVDFALDLLRNEVNNTVPDIVPDGIVDPVICMPLPERIVGSWDKYASHPKVEKFKLSEEEVQEQVEFQERLIEKLRDEEEKKKGPSRKKGFSDVITDMRYLRGRASHNGVGMSKSIQDEIVEDMAHGKSDEAEVKKRLREFIEKTSSALNHYLLFRFIDFTVEPGHEYRYRVKLALENPFHNLPVGDVEDPSLTIPERVETEYSEPTKPVEVKEDADFFLTHVDPKPGKASLGTADVDLYEWFRSTGTIVNKLVRTQLGEFVGKKDKALVLRPAEESFDMETVPFSTNDTLVDVDSGFALDPNLHSDILSEVSGPSAKKVTIASQAVIMKGDGSLARFDDGAEERSAQEQAKNNYNKNQNKPFDKLKEPKDDDALGKLGSKLKKDGPDGAKKKRGRKDPRRKMPGRK